MPPSDEEAHLLGNGPDLVLRVLEPGDLARGFLETLESLSDVEGLTPREARKMYGEMRKTPFYHVIVAVIGKEVVGTTTLLVEEKFIHHGGLVGHIEDVAVRKGYEGRGIGGSVVKAAVDLAREKGCYKVILDCKRDLTGFYEKLGFSARDVGMRIDLKPRKRTNAR